MQNNFFKTMQVKVPNRSAHSLNHFSAGTGSCGTLIPFLCRELGGNTKVNLTAALQTSLAPWATDAFAKCSINLEMFFVPLRLIQKGKAKWFTGEPNQANKYAQNEVFTVLYGTGENPITADVLKANFGAGTLSDYLGFKYKNTDFATMVSQNITPTFNLDKHIAYHLIWDTYYRNSKIQRSCFDDSVPTSLANFNSNIVKYITNNANYGNNPYTVHTNVISSSNDERVRLNDGVSLFSFRQRNWDLDYFTAAQLNAQQGSAQSVSFDTSQAVGSFTIASLRAANSLQLFAERNGLIGYDYSDWLYGQFGAAPRNGITQKPLYLGRQIVDVRTKGIYQTSQTSTVASSNRTNPFAGGVGASVGRAYADGVGQMLHHFVTEEPGYLFMIGSLVPRVTYSHGILRENMHYIEDGSVTDLALPLLQNTGNQPIYQGELNALEYKSIQSVYGYIDKYAEQMSAVDEIHGELRDGQTLSAFALQRSFAGNPQINNAFITIPVDYLNQVRMSSSSGSQFVFDYWFDIYFDFKVSHPLHAFSIPSLQDPAYEHGKTITVARTGQKLG